MYYRGTGDRVVGKKFDLLGIGSYCIDYLCSVSAYPTEDEKLKADDIDVQGGGNIATACVAVGRLGGAVCYHGSVGKDDLTEQIVSGLKKEGVSTEYVGIREGRNPLAFVVVNTANQSRTIIYFKEDIPRFGADDVDPELVRASKVLLIDFYHEEASLAASRIAREAGVPVIVDAEKDSPLAGDILANATHVVASQRFALRVIGKDSAADKRELVERFAQTVKSPNITVTLGKRGAVSLLKNGRRIIEQDAFDVDVVDTTGAGDVFHGAYALFLAQGYPDETILRRASACAAMKCRETGGRKGIPSQDELNGFLKDYEKR